MKLKMVGAPSSLRMGAAKRIAGWKRGAKQKPMSASSTHRATCSGPRSTTTPSVSNRSAELLVADAARPPCLQTLAPAPATTKEAMVETLNADVFRDGD